MPAQTWTDRSRQFLHRLGQRVIAIIEEAGYLCMLLLESLFWIVSGPHRGQPVRLTLIFSEAMHIGIRAIPIISVLCFSVGMMLTIQGIAQLKRFGAESEVIQGIAWSIAPEFSPLIVGILIAGRSGSAITARIGTMLQSQEIDALRVIGIHPIRQLATPVLIAMLVMLPCLTLLGDFMGILGSAIYTSIELQMPLSIYSERIYELLTIDNIMQGLIKSVVFAVLITLVGLANGFQVHGGAEGVGRATTRSVVMGISLIIIADMIFTYFLTR